MSKITALFLSANPAATNRLGLDREFREIADKIRSSEHSDLFRLESAWAVRPDDLLYFLNRFRPQIVHFSGHGSTVGEIILVDSSGAPKPVSTKAMEALFATLKDNIRIVIMNACNS
jgi:hypothetical protein